MASENQPPVGTAKRRTSFAQKRLDMLLQMRRCKYILRTLQNPMQYLEHEKLQNPMQYLEHEKP